MEGSGWAQGMRLLTSGRGRWLVISVTAQACPDLEYALFVSRLIPGTSPMEPDLSTLSQFPTIRTVLVVDDAAVVRRLSFRILSEAGYRVFEAASAVEALEVIDMMRGRVDLVLVDVVMPEVNGVDFVRLIREEYDEPSILFMSAYPAEVLAHEGLKDLRVQFLAKPFTRDELLAAVVKAIAPRRRNGEQSATTRPDDKG
jgi:CheY-like chemotaxis protein